MFYRIDEENNIIDKANFKYADDCLETDKNIIRGFDGKLIFEEETQTKEYLQKKQEFETKQDNEKRKAYIEKRLKELDQDFRQVDLGAVFEDIEARKAEFIKLHNELRVLLGKEPREYK